MRCPGGWGLTLLYCQSHVDDRLEGIREIASLFSCKSISRHLTDQVDVDCTGFEERPFRFGYFSHNWESMVFGSLPLSMDGGNHPLSVSIGTP